MSAKFSGSLTRCIAYLGAALFIGVSAAQNISHGYNLGLARSETAALIFGAGSLAGACMGPASFLAAWNAFRNWRIGAGLIATLVGCCCVIYATTSSLGFVGTARDMDTATRSATLDSYAFARDKAKAANAELKTLAELPRGNRRTEQERADRKAKLERDRDDAQRVMSAGSTATVADPTAAAIASYAGALGYEIEAAKLSPWLTLLAVVFFEIGASASLIVCAALPTAEVEKPAPAAKGRKRAKPLDDVLAKIKAAGGQLEGSISVIGSRLGLSKSAAHRALHTLAGLGAVSLATSAAGTLVQLRG